MTDIRELLGDVADQAKVYDVSGPVVQGARRHQRRMRWLAPVAVATAVALAAAAGWVVWPDARSAEQLDPADRNPLITNLGWLPPEARAPAAPPPVLPTNRAVGRATLAYGSCGSGGCYAYLLLSDGMQYRLTEDRQQMADVVSSVSLSPDGRWLGQQVASSYVLRDLTGVAEHRIPRRVEHVSWSPNSRWMSYLNADRGRSRPYPVTVVDMRNFRSVDFSSEANPFRAALLDTGELVYGESPQKGDVVTPGENSTIRLLAVNPATRRTRVVLDADITDALRDKEEVNSDDVQVTQDGTGVLLRVVRWSPRPGGGASGQADDILRVTWRGQVTRYELPTPRPQTDPRGRTPGTTESDPPSDELWAHSGEQWVFVEQYGKDLLLMHRVAANADLQALDTTTGKRRTVCRFADGVKDLVIPRGF